MPLKVITAYNRPTASIKLQKKKYKFPPKLKNHVSYLTEQDGDSGKAGDDQDKKAQVEGGLSSKSKQSQRDRKKGIKNKRGIRREGGEAAMRDDQSWCLK